MIMPAGNESDGGVGVKKRQPALNKTNSFGPASGYSTDESSFSHDANDRSKKDKRRRGGRRPDQEKDGGKASVIWMVLVIGILFCLIDAMYISRVLDRGGSTVEVESQSVVTQRVLEQIKKENQDQTRKVASSSQFVPQTKSEMLLDHSSLGGLTAPKRRQALTPQQREERRKQREAEAKIAEVERIKIIKAAALDALKAQHGGKIPDDMVDQALEDEESQSFTPRPMSDYKEQSLEDGKARILDLFIEAGLKEMDDSTYSVLPSWHDVKSLYGDEPKILGLEKCIPFRGKGNPWDHFVSTAGTFNSGTNLMAEMLIHNCHMQDRMEKLGAKNRGIRWQVPWGKHTPPGDEEYRLEHKSIKDKDVDANMILPAVTVRDPYYWMQSMCKHHYTASWRSSDRCPNLTPSEMDKANYPMLRDEDHFPVSVRYADFHRHHESLTGLWNDWYGEYRNAEFQHLFVRYEDLLFHPRNVTETVCHCAGGVMNRGRFHYVVDSAKKGIGAHGNVRTGYIDAIIKYGSDRNRYNGYHPEDLAYARKHLDEKFMNDLGYKFHPLSLESGNEKKDDGEQDGGNEHEDEQEEHKEEDEEPEVPDADEEEAKKSDAEESADLGEKPDANQDEGNGTSDEDEEAAER